MTVSSVAAASASPKAKSSTPSKDFSYVDDVRKTTLSLLKAFPFLETAPDIMYWLMATWGAESSWRLMHNHGGVLSSIHYTASPPSVESVGPGTVVKSSGTLTGNGYQFSPAIQNVWNDPATTVQIKNNIKEGWYAHGISACMGSYHVRGCPNNRGEWRYYPEAVKLIESLGLEVNPGQSISQTLFPIDDDTCRTRSVASGMVIFNYKYRKALETTCKNNPTAAIQQAIGNFLGNAGARDGNGVSPEDRVRQLNATSSSLVSILDAVNVRRTGDTSQLSTYLVDMSNKQASARSATQVQNVAARGATTNGGSNGVSATDTGCKVV